MRPQTAFGSQANSAIEIGVVGAGGRGNWISDLFVEFAGARVVAVAEPFEDGGTAAIAKYKIRSVERVQGP